MKRSEYLADEAALLKFSAGLAQKWLQQDTANGLIIWLQGDLGAGKTTFARGFLHGLGYQGVVKSPTYTLLEPYRLESGVYCYHFDLYRLTDPEELEFTGARDYFDGNALCLIEWPEKAAACLPDPDIKCRLTLENEGRQMELKSDTNQGDSLLLGAVCN